MPRGGPRANSGGAREGAGRPPLPTVPYQAKMRPETIERLKAAKARHGCGNIGELIDMALDALEREEPMKKFSNTNERFGMSGPFEARSKENLADEMMPTLRTWAKESGKPVESLRAEFIAGLVEEDGESYITCAYCNTEMPGTENDEIPALHDDEAWEKCAKDHGKNCEWIATRAHRIG